VAASSRFQVKRFTDTFRSAAAGMRRFTDTSRSAAAGSVSGSQTLPAAPLQEVKGYTGISRSGDAGSKEIHRQFPRRRCGKCL
jgi:hypothetical protein